MLNRLMRGRARGILPGNTNLDHREVGRQEQLRTCSGEFGNYDIAAGCLLLIFGFGEPSQEEFLRQVGGRPLAGRD